MANLSRLTSGTVEIPFASFIPNAGFPPIDFGKVHGFGLAFRGSLLAHGTYIFDDLQIASRITAAPKIVVEQPIGIALLDGSANVDYGTVFTGGGSARTFTIRNTGGSDLTGLGITISGPNSKDFRVTVAPTAPVAGSGGSTTFTVAFLPGAVGARSAMLHIASNDSDESPFDITLTGTGSAPLGIAQRLIRSVPRSPDPGTPS